MLYYVTLMWNKEDPDRSQIAWRLLQRFCATARDWRTVVEHDGMIVCCKIRADSRADNIYKLAGGRGVVLGKLFERSYAERSDTHQSEPAAVSLTESRSAALVASKGCNLIDQYWGRYVAFLEDPASRSRWVIRDPSGEVPCQWTRVQGIDVYFVRLEDCEQLGSLQFSINRHFLLGYLMYSSSCVRETSLNEVETVLPGECIEHRAEAREHKFLWNPLEISRSDLIEEPTEATRVLRNTIRACTHAWASCFDGILHLLSGGLDSSIVASCLADAPTAPRILCRNNYLDGPNSDERYYARLAAQRAGFELIEREAKSSFGEGAIRHAIRSLFPVAWPIDLDDDQVEYEFLRSRNLAAEFTGHGGDELFFRFGSNYTAVDYAWQHGLHPQLFSIALADAAADHVSVWRVLDAVRRFGVLKRPWHIGNCVPLNHMPLMSSAVREAASRDMTLWHPLYRDPVALPPGKFEQSYLLSYGTGKTYDPLRGDNAPIYVSPLLSQPVIELCLRTPLYVLRAGGQDRAIVRRAFAADVPWEIITRKSKAFGTQHYRNIISRNLYQVRELLLDGFLIREGFLNRDRLERMLSGQPSTVQGGTMELCDYLSVEAWARHWDSARHLVAA